MTYHRPCISYLSAEDIDNNRTIDDADNYETNMGAYDYIQITPNSIMDE